MHIRHLVPMGLALIVTAGCQSYFPNGYGYNGPYSSIPAGTYAPGTAGVQGQGGQFPTPVRGQSNSATGSTGGSTSNNSKSVPNPKDVPSDLGAAATGDDLDSIKRSKNSGGNPGKATDDVSDEPDEPLSSLDDEKFVSPALYRSAMASVGDGEPRRLTAKPRPSPYKKDADGYRWLRGTVARDPKTKAWRITYSDNSNDGDLYGGNLALIDDEILDTLIDNDVIVVDGSVDESVRDRFGKPCYRVQKMEPLVPKTN